MAHLIKKPSALGSDTVYYSLELVGLIIDLRHSPLLMTSAEADAVMENTDGKNGGWTGVTTETV